VENRSASAENVELVRFSFEAFGRGDFDQAFAVRFVAHLADPWTNRFGPALQ
jgi:hypothetical protein